MLDFSRIDLLSSYNIAKDNMCYYKCYMVKKITFFILLNLLITNSSKATDITNVEWNSIGYIQVTVYKPDATSMNKAECVAFYIPEDNKPIGGDVAFYSAGIAQVTISVPNSYKRKDLKNFEITCK